MIISVDELKERIDEENLVLVDCFYNLHEYRRGHIPSAIKRIGHPYVKSGDITSPGLYFPDPHDFEDMMNEMGIGPETTVVAYDGDGSLFAARFLWGLLYHGHKKVKLLDGGWQAWIDKGFPVSNKIHLPQENSKKFIANINAGLVISKEQLIEQLTDTSVKVIDARSQAEYNGEESRGNKRAGRVPGSVLLEWTNFLNSNTGNLSKIKTADQTKHILDDVSITSNNSIVTYCQGGVRAALVAYVLYAHNYTKICVYDGSMKEWANESSTPLK